MEASNVFLLLVSPDFVASDFIMNKEVAYATERAQSGTAQVVSIIDPDEAWLDVEKGIIEAIKVFTGDLIGTFPALAEPALRAMRAYEQSDTSSLVSSLQEGGETPVQYHCITDFWKGDLADGTLVSLKCTLSRYAPLVVRSPFKKREAYLAFRKKMQDAMNSPDVDEAKLNALLSFTAGQMVWSINFPGSGFRFFGLYQAIVRNSIPLFVTEAYHQTLLRPVFEERGKTFDARVTGRVRRLPKDFASLFTDSKWMGTQIIKPKLAQVGRPIYDLFVDDENPSSSVIYSGRSWYLDGDIWVAVRTPKTGTQIYSRFCNLADESDIADYVKDLERELHDIPNYEVVSQFDQEDRRFKGKQLLEPDDIQGITFKRKKPWWRVF